jgi:hypothetical protein
MMDSWHIRKLWLFRNVLSALENIEKWQKMRSRKYREGRMVQKVEPFFKEVLSTW